VSLKNETLKNRKEDFRSKVLKKDFRSKAVKNKDTEKKESKKKGLIEIRGNEAIVRLHLSAQHT
jgi:hypothetical protein